MELTHRRSGMFGRADIAGLAVAYLRECLAEANSKGFELGVEVPQEILGKIPVGPCRHGHLHPHGSGSRPTTGMGFPQWHHRT